MKTIVFVLLLILCIVSDSCTGQTAFGTGEINLVKQIALPGVKGRIDHMDVNPKAGILFMAALGNNTLEVIDLLNGKRLHTIGGLHEPQGVGYISETNEIFVANGGSGDCYFYNAKTFEKTATIHLSSDADDVRYDETEKKVYVGYGDGGIAVIDAVTHKQTGDIKLPGHPESFQMDKVLNKLFVNVPDAHIIAVIDLKQMKITDKWNTGELSANFPMAVDVTAHRLFIGYRHPSKLVMMKSASGEQLSASDMIGDVDDLYYDVTGNHVYISGGGGAIDVFQIQQNALKQISHIPTRNGARTSIFIPSLHLFVLAERANGNNEASALVYSTSK